MWPCSILDNVARLMPLSLANSCWLHANASLCSVIRLARASARAAISGSRVLDLLPPLSRARPGLPSAKPSSLSTAPRMRIPFLSAPRRLRLPNSTTVIRANPSLLVSRQRLSATLSGGETTLTDALARRDALTLRYGNLKTLVSAASDRLPRYGRAEIRILSAVEVGPLRRRMDELARERRELDISIQQANWATDLMED